MSNVCMVISGQIVVSMICDKGWT